MTARERVKEERKTKKWYKSHGICPICRKEKLAPGRSKCLNCLDENAIAAMMWRSNMTQKQLKDYEKKGNERAKERRRKRREAGLCEVCGRPRIDKRLCVECRIKARAANRKYMRKVRDEL